MPMICKPTQFTYVYVMRTLTVNGVVYFKHGTNKVRGIA